jgi:L-alanine-DL-glutamate epimerase-like enolase superfamily enzyme
MHTPIFCSKLVSSLHNYNMLRIQYKTVQTPFRHPFRTAHGVKTHQSALFIAISFQSSTGIGEAPAIHYYNVTVEDMINTLLSKIEILQRYSFTEPERFWHFCHHLFPNDPFLVCALDMAYWDMYASIQQKKIWEIWDLKWENMPLTDYTIGIDSAENMRKKIQEKPWPIYKIKVANKEDIFILKELRKETNAIIRIDANGGWTKEEALEIIPTLHELQIECIEQPLAKTQNEEMLAIQEVCSIPLFADESCLSEMDVSVCAKYFDGINIKLTKCGGLTPAYRMIKHARELGLKIMMGCMNETEPGSYAIAQFLPLLDYVDMDGPLLLETPPLKRLRYEAGVIHLL